MKKYVLNTSLIISLLLCFGAWGQSFTTIAEDDASNYGTWDDGSNEGTGFNPWTLTADGGSGGFAGRFIGNPSFAGISDMNSSSFGLFSNPNVSGNESKARRTFSNGEMQIGDVFSFQMGMNFDANNPEGFKGIDLLNSSGVVVLNFNMGNSSSITYGIPLSSDSGTVFSAYGTNAMNFTITRLSESEYTIEATPRTGSINFNETFDLGGNIAGFELYSGRLDPGDERQVYFNEFKIERPTFTTIADGDFSDTATWAGGVIPNGSGSIEINHDVDLDTDLTLIGELSIAADKTLAVNEDVVLTNNGALIIDGDLVLKSSASGTAQYGESSGNITGEVTVERFIPQGRAFRFLSSAVSDVTIANSWQQAIHITGSEGQVGQVSSEGFDQTGTGNSSMFTYDAVGQSWEAISNTNATNLNAGQAYRVMVRGSRETVDLLNNNSPSSDVTLSAKGNLLRGSYSVPSVANDTLEFTFVGNPYHAIVDLEQLSFGDGVNGGFAYYWDPTIADRGAYVIVDIAENNNEVDPEAPSSSSSNANKYLQPGQAVFFANTDDENATDYSIAFEESNKASSQPAISVFSDGENTYTAAFINLRLYETAKFNAGEKEQDAIGFRFRPNGNNAFDNKDAQKMSNISENLGIVHGSRLLSIEDRALPTQEEVLQLSTQNYQLENYTFRIHSQNLPENVEAFLVDQYTGESHAIAQGITTYSFSIDSNVPETTNNQRFSITFDVETLSQTEFSASSFSIYPNPVQDQLNINWNTQMDGDVTFAIYNLVGRKVADFDAQDAEQLMSIPVQNLHSGVYFLQVQHREYSSTVKFIKK